LAAPSSLTRPFCLMTSTRISLRSLQASSWSATLWPETELVVLVVFVVVVVVVVVQASLAAPTLA
jgi:hypothetical protein